MRISSIFILALSLSFTSSLPARAQTPAKRQITADDYYRLQDVENPQCSPDGKWIAYTVATFDRATDKRVTALWMVNWEGTQTLRLSYGTDSASTPRWSPDGKYLAFLTARAGEGKTQVWLMDRRGGEAWPLTNVKEELGGYAWSPDGKRLVLEMSPSDDDESTADSSKSKFGCGQSS